MHFLLNGYYGYDNAGDEAVLCAVMDALRGQDKEARFTVTSGNPVGTVARYGDEFSLAAVPRHNPRALLPAIRACDVFVSGGGSLLQDVTSLRNVVYYTGLMRLAKLARKPVVVYAQGMGPLRRPLSQKLARIAVQGARVVTVRDEDSAKLLRRIGVRREVEVTADPVWALRPEEMPPLESARPVWNVAVRSWPGTEHGAEYAQRTFQALGEAVKSSGAQLRFVPMQPSEDAPLVGEHRALIGNEAEAVSLENAHPRQVMAQCGRGAQVMIAMRLHALIFAAAQGVPCVALNYDPKVEALAGLIEAPLLSIKDLKESARVKAAVEAAQPLSAEKKALFLERAARTAQLAVGAVRR